MPQKKWPIGTALANSVDELSVDDEDDDDDKDEDDDDDDDDDAAAVVVVGVVWYEEKNRVSRMIFTLGR